MPCCQPWVGRTALNLGIALAEAGILEKYGVQLIGAQPDTIRIAEDRQLFKEAMDRIGLKMPASVIATNAEQALALAEQVGYPLLVRASFTLGGAVAAWLTTRQN